MTRVVAMKIETTAKIFSMSQLTEGAYLLPKETSTKILFSIFCSVLNVGQG